MIGFHLNLKITLIVQQSPGKRQFFFQAARSCRAATGVDASPGPLPGQSAYQNKKAGRAQAAGRFVLEEG
jgi:hypothetical protein